ncbi:MAG TPA: hypothetical protein VGL32_09905 [Acidimicrobiales bacterium]|jgi:hypothetical protein
MLYVFGFESIGVVVSDLYFVDPDPGPGQEGPERGVRLEVRMLDRGELSGSIYSAQPISVGQPVWRGDLLESVAGTPGSHDRTHHHPRFTGWEPGHRQFVEELSVDPLGWVAARLGDLDELLAEAGVSPAAVDPRDGASLRHAVPEIMESVRRLLERVRAGEAARPPVGELASARVGWL